MQDLADAAHTLGVSAHAVMADEEGLRLLPKPLVAHIEHDHFIAVLCADKRGVTYVCSDCGPWPGGQVTLNWVQWRKMEADAFLTVTRKGSDWDRALADLAHEPTPRLTDVTTPNTHASLATPERAALSPGTRQTPHAAGLRLTALSSRKLVLPSVRLQVGLRALMGSHVRLYLTPFLLLCGDKFDSLRHANGIVNTPMDCSCASGSSEGDPVNLATGEEEYMPPSDLVVYNPNGPPVVWNHLYNSLRSQFGPGEFLDYGVGWSHGYNIGIYYPGLGTQGSLQMNHLSPPELNPSPTPHRTPSYQASASGGGPFLLLPNGAQISFTPPSTPTAANPRVACSVGAGIPLYIEWDYVQPGVGEAFSGSFNICFPDGTVWITTQGTLESSATGSSDGWYPLQRIYDENNNFIRFNYLAHDSNGFPFAGYPMISSVTDNSTPAKTLLTINRDTSFKILSVADCYGRQVNFNATGYAVGSNSTWLELTNVSEIVPSGTALGPPYRYQYGYTYVSNPEQGDPSLPFLGTITTPAPNNPTGTVTSTIHYDNTYQLGICYEDVTSLVDANGSTRSYTAVDQNHTKVTVSNPQGTVVSSYTVGFDANMSENSCTDGANNLIYQAIYTDPNNPYGPSQVTDGNGIANGGASGVWQFIWDVSAKGILQTVTTPRLTHITYHWDTMQWNATGRLMSVQEGAKTPISFSYDALGRIQQILTPQPGALTGSAFTVPTSIAYTPLGNIASITTPGNNATLVGGVDQGITTSFNYTSDPPYGRNVPEAYGEPLTVMRSIDVANPSDQNNITHLWYDAQSNVTQVVYPILIPGLLTPTGTATASYNIANQPIQAQIQGLAAGTGEVQYTYQWPGGPCISEQLLGATSGQVNYTLGNEGELLIVSGNTQTEHWTYDAAYRLIADTDGANNTTQYTYNTQGYLSAILYPMNQIGQAADSVAFTSFDNDGNVLTRVDGRGVTTSYTYNDPESNLTHIGYPSGYSGDNTTLTYDPTYGRLEEVADGSGTRTYHYDDNDLVMEVDTTLSGVTGTFTQNYSFYNDAQLLAEAISLPGGSLGSFTCYYDTAGRLLMLTNPESKAFSFTSLDTDSVASQQSGSALNTSFSYDVDGALLSALNQPQGSGQPASSFTYTRDANLNTANLQAQFGNSGNVNTSFSYDTLNRLVTENTVGGNTLTHQYDGAGNPTTLRNVGATFNADNQNSASNYTYDGNGNPTVYPVKGVSSSLTYDAEDRLSSITRSGKSTSYGWTADGLRAWKQLPSGGFTPGIANGTKTYYLYDGGVPVCEVNSSGGLVAVNTFGPTGLAARYTPSTSTTFYAWDGRGNVAQTVNSSGVVTNTFGFDAYGKPTGAAAVDPYSGYGGQEGYYTDVETGLTLCGARFYDGNAARFLNRDPIGQGGGANVYQYVGGSPLMGADPSGLQPPNLQVGAQFTEFDDASNFYDQMAMTTISGNPLGSISGGEFQVAPLMPASELASAVAALNAMCN